MRSLKVMVIKCDGRAGPYVIDDLKRYFEILGHETCTADLCNMVGLTKIQVAKKTIEVLRDRLREFLPDMIVAYGATNVISFHFDDGSSVDLITSLKIPSVSIFYDSPYDYRVFDRSFEVWNPNYHYFFIWDHHYVNNMKKLGMKKAYFMPIGTNIRRFKKLPYDSADEMKYGADVSFVGSYTPKRELVIRKLLDGGFKPVIWGYEWEKARDKRIRELIRGVANNETDLVKVYNYSKININLTVDQGISSLNMRVFDCMASGGFLISDYKTDFEELFDINNEVVCYQTIDEIPGLVRYYLDHEEDRLKKAKNARRRVLSDHSYQNRVKFIIETMEANGEFEPPYWWEKCGDPAIFLNQLLDCVMENTRQSDKSEKESEVAPA